MCPVLHLANSPLVRGCDSPHSLLLRNTGSAQSHNPRVFSPGLRLIRLDTFTSRMDPKLGAFRGRSRVNRRALAQAVGSGAPGSFFDR